jgi:hypothetical protein
MAPERNDPCPCGSGKKYKKCCYLNPKINLNLPDKIPDINDYLEDDDEDYEEDSYDDDYSEDDHFDEFINGINNIRMYLLKGKPYIREYFKLRNMHSEIINAMIKYYHDGKFKRKEITDAVPEINNKNPLLHLIQSDFNLKTRVGAQAFYDMMIYKTAYNLNCITEDFIEKNRYRKPEKMEFLRSMLNSKLGLFVITGTSFKNGYAYFKEVFTGAEYKIIDIGLSGQANYNDVYIYTRIITHKGISFGSGLNFIFYKTDNFIKDHIRQHKKDYYPNGEFLRFTQMYNQYSKEPDRVKIVYNTLK